MENTNYSELVVIGVGTQGKNIAEQIGKECAWVSCFSFQDEKEMDDWGEKHLSEKILAVIVSCMDDANEEMAVARLVKDAKKNNAFAVVILGARGDHYTEIADNSDAVLLCSKSQHASADKQYKKLYDAVRGLALVNAPEAVVSLDVSDIAIVLQGECQFGVGTAKNALIAARQALNGLSGHNCLLYFLAPEALSPCTETLSLCDVNEVICKAVERLDEDANILFGLSYQTEKTGKEKDFVQIVAYTSVA